MTAREGAVLEKLEALERKLDRLLEQGRRADRSLLTRRQAAKELGVGRETLDAWIAEGRLVEKAYGSRRRIPRAELARLQKDGLPSAQAPRQPVPIGRVKGWRP